ncbi:hypothetical protein LAUMK13_00654 [Mycobacterium innocens]|uniref:Uncharacterized protein n=1 Tax=Mycobacterium innocens TaxID=2341083 RepID=A0A498PP29_9MYCO|nr:MULTISPECIES: hypothetical protein [Mycobacterium]VBA35153.1 hypothetical protein LAUMK13_00654 [Mycobacterium innocens]
MYLGLAGLRHIAERGEEIVVTWTDLLVFVMVMVGAAGIITPSS